MKKFALRNLVLLLCLTMAISFTGCASEAKKAMDESVDTANELLEKGVSIPPARSHSVR